MALLIRKKPSGGVITTAPSLILAGTGQGATGSLTYDLAASGGDIASVLQADDVLFSLIHTCNEAPGQNPPAGHNSLTIPSNGIGTAAAIGSVAMYATWKRCVGGEVNISFGDSGDHTFARTYLIRGCKKSGVPVICLNSASGNVSEPVGVPVSDTTTALNLILYAAAHGQDLGSDFVISWSDSALTSGSSPHAENGTTLGNGGGLGAYFGVKTAAGSLGSPTIDMQNVTQPLNVVRASFAFLPVGA